MRTGPVCRVKSNTEAGTGRGHRELKGRSDRGAEACESLSESAACGSTGEVDDSSGGSVGVESSEW